MQIGIKRIYDEKSIDDGKRILIDRLWPRGIAKVKANIDDWEKEIAPSNELRKWFNHEDDKYNEFRRKYLLELNDNKSALNFRKKYEDQAITLLYAAKNVNHNNAVVLKEWLENK